MNRLICGTIAICALGFVCVRSSAAQAQVMDAAEFYSQGVHAYFAGHSPQSEAYLSTAVALNPNDPRGFYFRALSLLRQGRRDEALSDMQMGAALEAQQPGRFPVGTSLERVQGSDRLLLEQYRREGQLSEVRMRLERDQARYTQMRASEPETLHQKATIPLGGLMQTGGTRPVVVYGPNPRPRTHAATMNGAAQPPAAGAANVGNPFSDDATATSGPAVPPAVPVGGTPTLGIAAPAKQPAAMTPAAEENPFGDPPATLPTSRPATSPPAGRTPTPTPTSPKTTPAAEDENPFRSP